MYRSNGYPTTNSVMSSRASQDGSYMTAMSIGSSVSRVKLPAQGVLKLRAICAESLSHVHLSPTTGPYLVIAHGKTRLKTNIDCTNGTNPEWNEEFELYISSSDIRKQSVIFQAKNKKPANKSGSSIIGTANVKLLSLCGKERTLLVPLKSSGSRKPSGVIKIQVNYVPWDGRTGHPPTSLSAINETVDLGPPPPRRHHRQQQQQQQQQRLPSNASAQMMHFDQRDDASAQQLQQYSAQQLRQIQRQRERNGEDRRHMSHARTQSGLPPLGRSRREDEVYYKEPAVVTRELVVANHHHPPPSPHHHVSSKPNESRRHKPPSSWRVQDYMEHRGGGRRGARGDDSNPSQEISIPSIIDTYEDESVASDVTPVKLKTEHRGRDRRGGRDHRGRNHRRRVAAGAQPPRRYYDDNADVLVSSLLKSKFLCF